MRTDKLHVYILMMGGPRRTGVCVAILMLAVAHGTAQAGDSLQLGFGMQEADGTAEHPAPPPSPSPGGLGKLPSGLKGTFLNFRAKTKPLNFHGTADTPKDLEMIGGKVREASRCRHVYKVEVASEGKRQQAGPVNGHTGKAGETWRGEATREGVRHFFEGVSDGVREEQTSGASDDERPGSIFMNSPCEDQYPPVPDDESAGWSREADLWRFREGKWKEVRLPDPSFPSLPTPAYPTAALIVATIDKVEVERRLEGLKNVTIHFRVYLSDSHHPDTLPELEVYFVKDGSRKRLAVETTRGAWQERTIHVPETDSSSVIIEGWLKAEGDIIALSNLYTTGVTPARDEALDADSDQMTLIANTTNVTSTLEAEGKWTESADQDNATRFSIVDDTEVDALQSPVVGDTEEGTGTVMPTDEFEGEASTDIPESETQVTEEVNKSTAIGTLNSSVSDGDNMTSGGRASSDVNPTMTTTDAENNETYVEEKSTTATATDGESGASENGTEDATEGSAKEQTTATTLFIPGLTTDSVQTNASVMLPNGNATDTGGPLITTEASVNYETSSSIPAETRFTDGQNVSTNVFGTDKGTSDTTLGRPESSATLGNVTGGTLFPGGVMMESTPAYSGNKTDAVVAVPVSSTSWQVFQIFLVLCVMGLLALGFLYWKRKRRQDDEIPVFTRHTDYHNPTFTMEDAANFMSRAGRNTYKTIE